MPISSGKLFLIKIDGHSYMRMGRGFNHITAMISRDHEAFNLEHRHIGHPITIEQADKVKDFRVDHDGAHFIIRQIHPKRPYTKKVLVDEK